VTLAATLKTCYHSTDLWDFDTSKLHISKSGVCHGCDNRNCWYGIVPPK